MQNQLSTEIGTELLFENDRIRVWQMVLQPGEESPHHRHQADYVFVYTTPSRMTAFLEGQEPSTSDFDEGYVQYTEVGPGTNHHIRNSGTIEHRQILVEIKGPSVAQALQTPENNGRSRATTGPDVG
jgi:quercetin dioxygenase-like cupin family protein